MTAVDVAGAIDAHGEVDITEKVKDDPVLNLRSTLPDQAALRRYAEAADQRLSHLDPVSQARAAVLWVTGALGLDQVILASSMGDEVLVHLASQVAPNIKVLFLDTGYHFAETIGTRDAVAATRPIRLLSLTPVQSVAEQDAEYGPRLYERQPDLCCKLRKVEPLERGLSGHAGWLTGMRRADAPTRTDIRLIGWDERRGMVKVNPLAAWDDELTNSYADTHGVLINPLRQIGYTSIGCEPCTRPTAAGEDPRAGRWAGKAKTECGLHT